jgi:competence protein ComEC
MRQGVFVMWLFVMVALPIAQVRASRTLSIYVIDVEGGNATLFVSPAGESLLIDTGNPGARDALRIVAAAKDAGVTQIDHLILSHYHADHFGGLTELAARMPIRHFIDHGPGVEAPTAAISPFPTYAAFFPAYAALYAKAQHTVAGAGDRISVSGLDVRVVMSAGQAIRTPLPGAGKPNPYCAQYTRKAADASENAQSVGTSIRFGKFHLLFLGDLTWNKEFELMCPDNRVGAVDVFIVSQHGNAESNGPVLVHAIGPRVALMSTGTRKGGHPGAMQVLHTAPRFEDLWQTHFSVLGGQEYTVPGMFIANMADDQPPVVPIAPMPGPPFPDNAPPPLAHDGPAYWIKASAQEDGAFTVTNTRNGFSKSYGAGSGISGR